MPSAHCRPHGDLTSCNYCQMPILGQQASVEPYSVPTPKVVMQYIDVCSVPYAYLSHTRILIWDTHTRMGQCAHRLYLTIHI